VQGPKGMQASEVTGEGEAASAAPAA